MEYPELGLPELLHRSSRSRHNHPAIIEDHGSISFTLLDRQSDRLAGYLVRLGIEKGARVGLYCPNCIEFVIAYFGILKSGAVVVPINLLLSAGQVSFILRDVEASALLYHPTVAEKVNRLDSGVSHPVVELVIGVSTAGHADTAWHAIMTASDPCPVVAIDPTVDLAAILYTSGTTGQPKGAMLTHRNLAINAWSTMRALQPDPDDDRIFLVLPLFHAFAATVGMLLPLLAGCTIILQRRFDPAHTARAINDNKATIFLGVPTMYTMLLGLPAVDTGKLESLRLCICGGAALPAAVQRQFEQRFGKPIHEGDGPTECGPVTSVNPLHGPRKAGSIGKPVPLVEMKIVDPKGRELAVGSVGEICVRGPSVMQGYWKRQRETQEAFLDGWFRTGDLGYRDDEGYFFIVDRLKDLIIYNGMNVYPRVVEEILYRHPAVREAAVIGEAHSLHGEIPVAYVALKDGVDAAERDLIAFCRRTLGKHEIPRKVVLLPELPKTATGKIVKRSLRIEGETERGIVNKKVKKTTTKIYNIKK